MAENIENEVEVTITRQTFFDLCTWLVAENGYSKEQAARLQKEDDYLAIVALANQFWLLGALKNKLSTLEIWHQLPSQLTEYLSEFEQLYFQRSETIQQETILVCSALKKENIDIIILKGAASLFNGVSNPISSRFMADVDVLVPEIEQEKAVQILDSLEYSDNFDEFDIHSAEHHHAPAKIRKNGQCYVELHRWALKKSSNKILSTPLVWQHAKPLKLTDELSVKQLSPTHQIIHSIAHSEVSDRGYELKQIELRQLLNIYAIAHRFGSQINWLEVEQHFVNADKYDVLMATLYNAFQLFKLETPITNRLDSAAKAHFNLCLNKYEDNQGVISLLDSITHVFSGYNKETILIMYGSSGHFPLLKGRVQHLGRHLKMIFNRKAVKKFFNRL